MYLLSSFQRQHRSTAGDSVLMNNCELILTSGCWHWCRNPHLFAEIVMTIGWSLPAGMRHLSPWLYALYIIIMSIYKARYFDRALRTIYPPDTYDDYTQNVKYKLIPFVY
jgi:protein-S-isoprenylcysteine O-methyltransferase Ste14